jgi:hypothetical protein
MRLHQARQPAACSTAQGLLVGAVPSSPILLRRPPPTARPPNKAGSLNRAAVQCSDHHQAAGRDCHGRPIASGCGTSAPAQLRAQVTAAAAAWPQQEQWQRSRLGGRVLLPHPRAMSGSGGGGEETASSPAGGQSPQQQQQQQPRQQQAVPRQPPPPAPSRPAGTGFLASLYK